MRRPFLMLLALGIGASAFAPRVVGRGVVALRAGDFTIEEESQDFTDASIMFVESFWVDKAESGSLNADQRKKLKRDQSDEFKRRYGGSAGRRKSALFVARDAGGASVGCAGIELDGAAGDESIIPIMSNLAVGPAGRRRGLGSKLVRACEAKAKDWGYDTLGLIVEERNAGAFKLYSKLGYSVLSKDDAAATLVPLADGRIASRTTTTLSMVRSLKPQPPLAAIAAFSAFAAAAAAWIANGAGS
ncbi:acyl-CoA N-acyltransferase [Pelagophyceae sp. CCMP2097]|nr:acyl-CoA N-acyltransferase [Pelagophyceae sp. CCMP2097]